MPSPVAWTVYDMTGAPNPSASPTVLHYITRGLVPLPPPTINNLGQGVFSIVPSDSDRATGVLLLIDNGAGTLPRYVGKAIHGGANPFVMWWLEAADGSLYSGGGTPTFTLYDDMSGNPVTPQPTISPVVSPYLWQFTPSISDIIIGVGWQIQNPSGSYPEYVSGDTEMVTGGGGGNAFNTRVN